MRAWLGRLAAALGLVALVAASARAQGVTTAAVSGAVTQKEGGAPIVGADVTLRNPTTGELHAVKTRADGRFVIENASAGGPYDLSVRAIGFQPVVQRGLQLVLGQRRSVDFELTASTVELAPITIQSSGGELADVLHTGPATIIDQSKLANLPLQGRNFTDLVNTSPQANGNSIAGQNNRFNNIQVDGGVNNDLFGLAGSGTPGGQANATVISLEAIKEFQIQVAPFDIRLGNFAGGLINAVTKSGTNEYHGSVYTYYRGKSLAAQGRPDSLAFGAFNVYQYGGTFSGPIVKDKLQYFLSADLQSNKAAYTSSFNLTGNNTADSANTGFSLADAQRLNQILTTTYNFADPGLGIAPKIGNPDNNVFGKLSWQVGPNSRVEISHNYVNASLDNLTRNPTSPLFSSNLRDGYQLSNSGWKQANTTNTTRVRWTTTFGRDIANEFLAGGQWVRDHRDIANRTPLIMVDMGRAAGGSRDAWLAAGADKFSQGNLLNQNIYSVADNLSFNAANGHRVTVGTSDEFFKFHNVFTQGSYGVWAFASLDSLQNGQPEGYQINLPGDTVLRPLGAVADFSVQQIGLYLQDAWTVNNRITLTGGLRMDVPFFDKPITNPNLVSNPNLPINTGVFPSGNALWSPRFGFNFDADGRGTTVVRGGAGIFTGRPAYVWLSNAFVGTGLETVGLSCVTPATVPTFTAVLADQPKACAGGSTANPAIPSPVYFDKNFRFPQTFRIALGLDKQLPGGVIGTLDFLYTKNRNDLYIQDNNLVQSATPSGEGRYLYGTFNPGNGRATKNLVTTAMGNALFHRNVSGGRSYSFTVQAQKQVGRALNFNAGYTYSNTKDIISLTSSIAFSNYQFAALDGSLFNRNLATSAFDRPHSITLSGTLNLPYHSQFSLIYSGTSGSPYSWTVGGDANGDGIGGNDLPFVPADPTQITLQNPAQYDSLNAFITSQSCLNASRGKLLSRNTCRNPWLNFLNARVATIQPVMGGHTVELSIDLFNVLNFVDKNWGLTKQVTQFEEGPAFERIVGYDAVNNRPVYSYSPPSIYVQTGSPVQTVYGPNSSRWRMQFGAKYSF